MADLRKMFLNSENASKRLARLRMRVAAMKGRRNPEKLPRPKPSPQNRKPVKAKGIEL